VTRNRHGDFFWNTRVIEILDCRSTDVENQRSVVPALASDLRLRIRPFSKSQLHAGSLPGGANELEPFPLVVADPRAIGVAVLCVEMLLP